LIAVPLGTLALMSNLGSLICGAWFPLATELFNHSAWFFMSAMTDASEWSTRIPGSYFYVPEPAWLTIGIYYSALVVILSGWLKTVRRKIFFAGVLVFIGVFYFWQWENSRDETKLTVLPLNGGHSVFVDATGRKNDWLIDCGDKNTVNFTLKNFLRAQGVNTIPRLVLTEGELKNCGGAELLDQLFGVGELWTSPVHFRSGAYNGVVLDFEKSSRHKILNEGDKSGGWQILWPAGTNNFPRADDNALVLLGNFPGAKILLLSDLGRDGQSALLSRTNNLGADIVIAGLPDEGEPLCDALIDAIHPKIIVIADSEFPANRRASRKLKERLEQTKIPVIYTRDSGAATILTGKNGWQLRTMDGQKFEGT
jgi:beta-lactamase superfamily II metal-dependent hydrolase